MGLVKLSQKVKHSPIVGVRYWNDRDMPDFMPHTAYTVPVEGGLLDEGQLDVLQARIYDAETSADPVGNDMAGVHIEQRVGQLTVTLGVFAT